MVRLITILSMFVVPVLLYLVFRYLMDWEQKKALIVAGVTALVLIVFGVRDLSRSRS